MTTAPRRPSPAATGRTNTLQTLDRGLQVLALVSTRGDGLTVAEIAQALGVHRAIAYRLVGTLELHGLVARSPQGRIVTGVGVLRLSAAFDAQFRTLAMPFLRALAEACGATAFLTIAQGDECTAIQVCEPQNVDFRMSYRVGSRHPVTAGAAGLAILAARPATATDRPELQAVRQQGFSITHGELQKGAVGIASPLRGAPLQAASLEACVGVVAMEDLDTQRCAELVVECAQRLSQALGASV